MTEREHSASGATRHRILRGLREQLETHPAVTTARGHPEGEYSEVSAVLEPSAFGRTADSATLRVTWQPFPETQATDILPDHPRTEFMATFRVHYSESTGYDCGFHNEPNPHVDGWFHFQERPSPNEAYEYEPADLDARTPTSAIWELLDKLDTRLRGTA